VNRQTGADRGNFLAWQWSDYPSKHRNRGNLVIHIVAVPLFMLGCVGAVVGLLALAPAKIAWSVGMMIAAVVLEGVGHRLEPEQPAPFDGFPDFVKRFFVEQWVTFPRFVVSGGYVRNLTGRAGP